MGETLLKAELHENATPPCWRASLTAACKTKTHNFTAVNNTATLPPEHSSVWAKHPCLCVRPSCTDCLQSINGLTLFAVYWHFLNVLFFESTSLGGWGGWLSMNKHALKQLKAQIFLKTLSRRRILRLFCFTVCVYTGSGGVFFFSFITSNL